MLKEAIQAQYLKALRGYDLFEAQTQLEDQLFSALSSKLLTLPLEDKALSLEYVKVRGGLEALKQLKAMRDKLANSAVEKNLNS